MGQFGTFLHPYKFINLIVAGVLGYLFAVYTHTVRIYKIVLTACQIRLICWQVELQKQKNARLINFFFKIEFIILHTPEPNNYVK